MDAVGNQKRIEYGNINFYKIEKVKLLDGRKIEAIINIANSNKKRRVELKVKNILNIFCKRMVSLHRNAVVPRKTGCSFGNSCC